MKSLFIQSLRVYSSWKLFNWGMFCFRVLASLELIVAHGFKKVGIGVQEAEHIPNPLHFPETFNSGFAIAANIVFPSVCDLRLLYQAGYFANGSCYVNRIFYRSLEWHPAGERYSFHV